MELISQHPGLAYFTYALVQVVAVLRWEAVLWIGASHSSDPAGDIPISVGFGVLFAPVLSVAIIFSLIARSLVWLVTAGKKEK